MAEANVDDDDFVKVEPEEEADLGAKPKRNRRPKTPPIKGVRTRLDTKRELEQEQARQADNIANNNDGPDLRGIKVERHNPDEIDPNLPHVEPQIQVDQPQPVPQPVPPAQPEQPEVDQPPMADDDLDDIQVIAEDEIAAADEVVPQLRGSRPASPVAIMAAAAGDAAGLDPATVMSTDMNSLISKMNLIILEDKQKHNENLLKIYETVATVEALAAATVQPVAALNEAQDNVKKAIDAIKQTTDGAKKIVDHYQSPLDLPTIEAAPDDYVKPPHRNSPREIVTATGSFDPKDKESDFHTVWNCLVSYGQAHYFSEEEYKWALFYVLKGEAKETLTELKKDRKSLEEILKYFGAVYVKKRSVNSDKEAVEKFARHQNEELESCMQRAEIVIDRLKVLHSNDNWPEVKAQLKRKILMKNVSDETRKHIQAEENDSVEMTGFPVTLARLIKLAAKHERRFGKFAPQIQTAYEQQIDQVPRGKSKRREFIQEVVAEVLANPAVAGTRGNYTQARNSQPRNRRDQSRSPSPGARRYDRGGNTQSASRATQTSPRLPMMRTNSHPNLTDDDDFDMQQIFAQSPPQRKPTRSPSPSPRSQRGRRNDTRGRSSGYNRSSSRDRQRPRDRYQYSRDRSYSRSRDRSSRNRSSSYSRGSRNRSYSPYPRGKRVQAFTTDKTLTITVNSADAKIEQKDKQGNK